MNKKGKIISMSFCVSMVLGSQLVAAQNNQNTTVLEEIKVSENNLILNSVTEETGSYTTGATSTATKLDLSLRETPQSVLVFTRQRLEDQNITSYQELLSKTPGVTLNKWDERVYPTARGFTIDYNLYDGMPTYSIADYGANDTDLIIFDRVEIVKGANGLMTGAGNPALGLNYIRKHANSKEFKGTIDLSAGSWDNYTSSVDVQTPLNSDGSVRARFVAKHQDKKSYMDNYEKQTDVFYGVVDMDLTDTTYLSLGASYEDIQRDGVRWGGLPAFYTDGSRTNFSRSKTVSDDWTYWDNKTTSYFADLKQYIYDDISINASYSNRTMDSKTAIAYYFGTVNKVTNNADGFLYDYVSDAKEEENNLNLYASIPFELAKLDHEIITGFGYNKYDFKKNNFAGTGYISASSLNFSNINIDNPQLSANTPTLELPSKTIQKGYYLAGRFSLMEDLKLISGIRVSSWEYQAKNGNGNREFDDEITPYAGLVYDIDKNHSIYVSYTSIFKPTDRQDKDNNYLDPAEGKSYETGIKGEYFDGRLNTSLSIFRIEQTGFEDTGIPIASNPLKNAFERIDGVVSKGFELGVQGNLTDDFSLDFGLANFEAENPDGSKFNTDSSRTTANLWAKYTISNYRFGAGLNYKSKFYTGSGANKITQDEFITTDLMAGYKINKNLDLQLNINNVFDEKYYEGIGANSMVYGDPRNFTLGMKYTF
ncbi:TonB-dependent siderophore receptor [Aliarcobacter butzleri]|uniref:TonB-dependent siderophore receptor n=1 Tax=Aliarcobacter butzleri TaxID=28197 RepID=A0AAP4PZ44_9BACT|nr:TonB-dependent siderophore receptor [Aliarcobacter butzleri]MDN5052398.1 TonB-dependent siderophore receptor [Aliarcobacter butzleri]MDN5075918.1 TonB-dependent siderophore receptor [Aliarcobacter butzleri]MDN5117318.1 TonB-dependent siderophore receptor [Aliarcobacter butzleri]MDN5132615.1 TonB-dependent siderophore receptor [Aliarcobacter butzleri]NUW26013.1 TonB-dependent siderophore receptor [Aliarcobacter butzleri]